MKTATDKGFYIGDPCYLYHGRHEEWMAMLKECDYFRKPFKSDEGTIIAVGTYSGDGTYAGTDGTNYSVDAGLIAVVPMETVKDGAELDYGRVVEGKGEASIDYDAGTIMVNLDMENHNEIIVIETYEDVGYDGEEEEREKSR